MAEVASAYVSLLPSAKGFGSNLDRQIGPDLDRSGKAGGQRYGSAFAGSVTKLIGLAAGAFVGVKAFGFLKGSIAEASDLSESVNAVRVSYGKAAQEVLAIGKNSATSFGLSKSEFNGFAVQFQSFSKTIAGANGDAAQSFKSIIGRATDFASVMNLDVGQAAELFQSGLAGETEPLRKYGIDLSAAAVEAFALSSGIVKNKKDLTEAGKVQARYGLLMKQTAKTQGDFKNTSGGLANQQRILAAQTKDLQASLGKALLPALTFVAKVMNNGLIPALRNAATFVRSNATTFKVLGAVLAGALLPYIIASTVAFVANAASVLTTNAAWLVYGLTVKAVAIGTKAYTAAQWLLNAALSANPIGLIIIGLIALGAAFVLLWKKSETFRSIVTSAFNKVKAAAGFVFDFIRAKWPLLLAILTGPIGIAVLLIVRNWDKIKSATSSLVRSVIGFFVRLKDGVADKVGSLVSFAKGIPGKIKSAIGDLGGLLLGAGKDLINGLINGIKSKFGDVKNTLGDLTGKLTSWKGPESLDKVILRDSGKYVIDGFITGLESRYPRVESSLGGLTNSLASSVKAPGVNGDVGNVAVPVGSGSGVNLTVNPQPGQSEEEIGRAAANRLLFAMAG